MYIMAIWFTSNAHYREEHLKDDGSIIHHPLTIKTRYIHHSSTTVVCFIHHLSLIMNHVSYLTQVCLREFLTSVKKHKKTQTVYSNSIFSKREKLVFTCVFDFAICPSRTNNGVSVLRVSAVLTVLISHTTWRRP
jgi:hypothetical protein